MRMNLFQITVALSVKLLFHGTGADADAGADAGAGAGKKSIQRFLLEPFPWHGCGRGGGGGLAGGGGRVRARVFESVL